jgi:hypothetical protein
MNQHPIHQGVIFLVVKAAETGLSTGNDELLIGLGKKLRRLMHLFV